LQEQTFSYSFQSDKKYSLLSIGVTSMVNILTLFPHIYR